MSITVTIDLPREQGNLMKLTVSSPGEGQIAYVDVTRPKRAIEQLATWCENHGAPDAAVRLRALLADYRQSLDMAVSSAQSQIDAETARLADITQRKASADA